MYISVCFFVLEIQYIFVGYYSTFLSVINDIYLSLYPLKKINFLFVFLLVFKEKNSNLLLFFYFLLFLRNFLFLYFPYFHYSIDFVQIKFSVLGLLFYFSLFFLMISIHFFLANFTLIFYYISLFLISNISYFYYYLFFFIFSNYFFY